MMRIIQITFIWLAGTLLLGHSFIPHHHHENNQEQCAKDVQHDHDHSTHNQNYNNCCNDDQENDHELCIFDQRTTVKDQYTSISIRVNTNVQIPDIYNHTFLSYYIFKVNFYDDVYLKFYPGRAPPIV